MDKIVLGNEYYIEVSNDKKLKKAQKMYFDVNNRFLICFGNEIVNLIPLILNSPEDKDYVIQHENCKSINT